MSHRRRALDRRAASHARRRRISALSDDAERLLRYIQDAPDSAKSSALFAESVALEADRIGMALRLALRTRA